MLNKFFKLGFLNGDVFDYFEKRSQEMQADLKDLQEGETKEIESTDEHGTYSKKVISKGLNGSYSISTSYYTGSKSLTTSKDEKMKALQANLQKAKEEERYEDCIKIRDEIKLLE